jgi:hypothetical protein
MIAQFIQRGQNLNGRKTSGGLITRYRGITELCTGNYGILRGKMAKYRTGGIRILHERIAEFSAKG